MRALLFIFSLFLLQGIACAQSDSTLVASDSLEVDSVVFKRAITPSLSLDYGKLFTLPFDFEQKFEAGIELLLHEKYPIIAEVGYAKLSPEEAYSNATTYLSEGIYYKLGFGIYNQTTPKFKLGFTGRFAMSSFDESMVLALESTSGAQDNINIAIDRTSLNAQWVELVIYTDQKINELISLGSDIRLRALLDYDSFDPVDVYTIPGYGQSFNNTMPSVRLFVKFSF